MEAFKKLSRPRGRVPRQACAWHPIEVCCQDEMRVDQKNKLTYCWARKGSRAPSTISAPNQPICSVRRGNPTTMKTLKTRNIRSVDLARFLAKVYACGQFEECQTGRTINKVAVDTCPTLSRLPESVHRT